MSRIYVTMNDRSMGMVRTDSNLFIKLRTGEIKGSVIPYIKFVTALKRNVGIHESIMRRNIRSIKTDRKILVTLMTRTIKMFMNSIRYVLR